MQRRLRTASVSAILAMTASLAVLQSFLDGSASPTDARALTDAVFGGLPDSGATGDNGGVVCTLLPLLC